MRTRTRIVAAAFLCMAFTLTSSPSWALSESGYKSCTATGNWLGSRGHTKGWAMHYFDGIPFNKGNSAYYRDTWSFEGWRWANWKVDGSIGINYVYTYAYCAS